MSWIRLDDGFADHPKVLAAGPLATVLYVRGLCYASRHTTDGFIPTGAVPALAVGLDPAGPEDLVRVGLWEKTEGGYTIHDFLKYNFSKAEIVAAREKKREAGRAGGLASAQARGQAGAQAAASPTVAPVVQEILNSHTHSPSPKDKEKRNTLSGKPDPTSLDGFQEKAQEIIARLNEQAGTDFKPTTKATQRHIAARIGEGYTVADLKTVVDHKSKEWRDDAKMFRYLRPITLFASEKFESYLQEAKAAEANEPRPPVPGCGWIWECLDCGRDHRWDMDRKDQVCPVSGRTEAEQKATRRAKATPGLASGTEVQGGDVGGPEGKGQAE